MSFLSPTPPPLKLVFRESPPPDDVTIGKMAFRENVRGTWKNSEPSLGRISSSSIGTDELGLAPIRASTGT